MTDETPKFGDHVEFSAIVGRLRKFHGRVGDGVEIDSATLDYGHGRRPTRHYWFRSMNEWENLTVLCKAEPQSGRRFPRPDTLVDLVRVPIEDVRGWSHVLGQEPDRTPMPGVVVGATRRQSGRVISGYEEGNSWTTTGAIPVVTVAVETDGAACLYDVHPDDLAPA